MLSFIGKWIGEHLLFSSLLESDDRLPVVTFPINIVMPHSILLHLNLLRENETTTINKINNLKFGLLLPRIEFWIALVSTLIMGAIYSSIASCIIYQCIILPRKERNNKRQINNNSSNVIPSMILTPYLVGFGIVMPLCALSPYYYLRYFGIKNKIIKFLAGVAQLTSFFRCSEAMFGFLPPNVEDSFSNLIIYTAFPIEIKFYSKGKGAMKSTWNDVGYYLVQWMKYIAIFGIYSSFMQAYDHQPFPNAEGHALWDIKLGTGFAWRQLINNALVAVLFQIYLTTFGYGINFLTSLVGYQQNPMMLNPIFESSSPSDFWGRRWNLTVHGILKRGVYKPFRTRYSRLTASAATFMASGLFHEWLLSIVFYPDFDDGTCSPLCYLPGYGRNTLFFLWNAMIISLEYAIGGFAIFQLCRANLPLPVVSLLVAATALPMAHWFTNDYVRTDFFSDAQIGFPLIVRVSE